jgi:hypothetical protein
MGENISCLGRIFNIEKRLFAISVIARHSWKLATGLVLLAWVWPWFRLLKRARNLRDPIFFINHYWFIHKLTNATYDWPAAICQRCFRLRGRGGLVKNFADEEAQIVLINRSDNDIGEVRLLKWEKTMSGPPINMQDIRRILNVFKTYCSRLGRSNQF